MLAISSAGSTIGGRRLGWLAFNGLGLYVMLMYGIAYYAISTTAPRMAEEFGIPVSGVFGLLSGALLATAVMAPRYGRWSDRFGAARVLLAGAVLRSAALACVAMAPDIWWFAGAFVVLQLLSQVTEYDAAFAAAVEIAGSEARAAMSMITLWGGVASTVFWPATTSMLGMIDWRSMLLIYAAVMLAVCMPVAATLAAMPRPPQVTPKDGAASSKPASAWHHIDTRFALLAAAFACGGIAYSLPALMLPVLQGLGLGASGLVAGMLFGPSQTVGRLFELLFGPRLHALEVAVVASAMVALSLAILLAGGGAWGALLFAVIYGAGAGVSYVVRGSIVLALYGTEQYASWLGRLGAIRLVVSAFIPLVLSLILERHGAWSVVAFCTLAAMFSLMFFVLLKRSWRRAGKSA